MPHGQRSILLTTPDGNQQSLQQPEQKPARQGDKNAAHQDSSTIQFDSDQIERGRGRIKIHTGQHPSTAGGRGSRSRSRASSSHSNVREEEYLKWTVLRQDPSVRLKIHKRGESGGTGDAEGDDAAANDESDSDSDFDTEESEEEQVSDVENDASIDEEFHYDLSMRVLPNFFESINNVIESAKNWTRTYEADHGPVANDTANLSYEELDQGYRRAMELVSKGSGATNKRSCILYVDLTLESAYALTYVMGAVVNNGETLYIVHWESNAAGASRESLAQNVAKFKLQVLYLFDCIGATIDDLDVVILSLTHPYPKHLLSEMTYGLKPLALCCSLSTILSSLQNYVCSVPTLVIRKKLKRSRRKGIMD